ncbi:glucose dehydrogenase [FAD, quinone]-like [Schistocerca nitens]|uniref:glucose dehydrogenase [FAD, quinone]-like n=1 Tax=Schistocerca nitens TaxID=7011 RepID=UPI0021185FC3|nr:glucose dehydrogenase [FAD, quinone]-like [Schistocerca nitens]
MDAEVAVTSPPSLMEFVAPPPNIPSSGDGLGRKLPSMRGRTCPGISYLRREHLIYELRVRGLSEEGDVDELAARLSEAADAPVSPPVHCVEAVDALGRETDVCYVRMRDGHCALADRGAYPPDAARPLPEYDFVVVGAGSAGSAVAARLSEEPAWTVLLLEAGGDPPPTADVPLLFPALQKTEADWSYLTEPDGRSCLAHRDGRCTWPRGKTLGGSSVLNAMMYVRGSPQDYDGWASLGNDGWSYEEVLPFFKKLEAFDKEELERRPHVAAVHGRDGAIRVSKPARLDPAYDALDAAATELGFRIIEDYSAEPMVGFGQIHCSIKNGTRWNAALGYLAPAKERVNLHVLKSAYVTKILIRPDTQSAYGVQFVKDGKVQEARATKEVIVSAGAINTPHILMHSGIGPKSHLEEVGITVIRDLRVGYNLQDHLSYAGLYYTRKPSARKTLEESVFEYLMNRTGILSTTGLTSYTGFIQTRRALHGIPGFPEVDPAGYPDIQLIFVSVDSSTASLLADIFNYKEEATLALKNLTASEDAVMVMTTLLAPRSRGRIRLRSAEPLDPPLIETGYLADPRDLETLLDGVELSHRLGSTEAMRAAGYGVRDLPLRECGRRARGGRDYWSCAAPHLGATVYHPVGTAKMGPSSDAGAVVDARLRLHGVRGLRVADASVMPLIVRCNTNVPSIMIGEKCAHMVAEDWRQRGEQ